MVLQKADTSAAYKSIGKTVRQVNVENICESDQTSEFFEERRTKLLLEIKDWLLRCASRSGSLPENALFDAMRDFLTPRPQVDEAMKSNYGMQRSERIIGDLGIWSDLTRTLATLHPSDGTAWTSEDDKNIVWAITAYLHLASNVVESQLVKDELVRSLEALITESERLHICLVESPFSSYSQRVRHALAETNYLGNWMIIESMVLSALGPVESLWMFFTYRWIMRAATHPDADLSGNVKRALSKVSTCSVSRDYPMSVHVSVTACSCRLLARST